jgi:hypothetical protein
MFGFELAECGLCLAAVDVQDKDTTRHAGGDRNVEVRISTPPALDHLRVDRSVEDTAASGRSFSARSARKYAQATFRQRQRSAQMPLHGITS